MDEFGKLAYQELEARRAAHRRIFSLHLVVWALTGLLLVVIWLLATPDTMPWFIIPILAWGIFLGGHAAWVFMIRSPQEIIIMDGERRASADADSADGSRQTATSAAAAREIETETVPAAETVPPANGDTPPNVAEPTSRQAK